VPALGQEKSTIELTRATIKPNRDVIVQHAMAFTQSEQEPFNNLYREWRTKVDQ
jgi:hypothetical protein